MIKEEKSINIKEWIQKLRNQRIYMVQTKEQYSFIHFSLVQYYLLGSSTLLNANTFKKDYKLLLRKQEGASLNKLQLEYNNLDKLKDTIRSKLDVHKYKQKFSKSEQHEAFDYCLVKLDFLDSNPITSFIDAVQMETSYMNYNKFIIASDPIDTDINEFIRMINEIRPKFIVSLSSVSLT